MKKKWYVILILGFVAIWLIILLLIYILTNKYRDQAIQYLKNYLDSRLTTEITIRKNDIHFNLINNFPNVSIELNNILIKSASGPDYKDFTITSKDTLLYADRVSFIFNLYSLLSNKYELKKIEIKNADLNILLDKKGRGNYKIFKPEPESLQKDTLSIELRKIKFDNIRFTYNDALTSLLINTNIKSSEISGSFNEDNFNFNTTFKAEKTSLKVGTNQFLFNESVVFNSDVKKTKLKYSFNKGNIENDGIKIDFTGEWNTLNNKYNFFFECKTASLNKLENTYLKRYIEKTRFKPVKGILNIDAKISGPINGNPHFILNFKISNGFFQNKTDNIKVESLYIQGSYTNGKFSNATTSLLKIDTLYAFSGKSNISARASLVNFQNPTINGIINGNFELEKINLINDIKSRLEISGMIVTQMKFSGNIPALNILKIHDFKNLQIEGLMKFEDINIKSLTNHLPQAKASGMISLDNLNVIKLNKINLSFGKSSLIIDGTVTNIPFFNDDNNLLPVYRCNVNSSEFHIEDLLINYESERKKDLEDKVEFPDSIIVFALFNAQNFSFGKFTASQVKGEISYRPKTLIIDGFSMNSQDGIMTSNIDITQRDGLFIANCNAVLRQLNIRTLFYSFNNFGQNVISSENLGGKISGNVQVSEMWDQYLNPILDKITLRSDYEIVNGEIVNYQPLLGLSRYIEVDELKHIRFDRFYSTINIDNSTVYLSQTDIQSSALSLTGSGEHHFDNSYSYRLQVQLSDILWSKAKKKKPENEEFGYVVEDSKDQTMLPLIIKGKGIEYEVNYDKKTAVKSLKEKVKKEKEVWKNILGPDNKKVETELQENSQKIKWEENQNPLEIKTEKNKNLDTIIKKEDFKIQWDDD